MRVAEKLRRGSDR